MRLSQNLTLTTRVKLESFNLNLTASEDDLDNDTYLLIEAPTEQMKKPEDVTLTISEPAVTLPEPSERAVKPDMQILEETKMSPILCDENPKMKIATKPAASSRRTESMKISVQGVMFKQRDVIEDTVSNCAA